MPDAHHSIPVLYWCTRCKLWLCKHTPACSERGIRSRRALRTASWHFEDGRHGRGSLHHLPPCAL